MRILVIEDNTKVAAHTVSLLTQNDYDVIAAYDSKQGLNILQNESFDLVLLALNTPSNSIDILQHIRSKYTNRELPVIILSDESNNEIVDRMFECGANDFIKTPFNDRSLLSRVDNQLRLRSATNQVKLTEMHMGQITKIPSDMAYAIDLELNTTYVNSAVHKVLDFTVDEYMKLSAHERYPQNIIDDILLTLRLEIAQDKLEGVDKERTRIIEIEQYHKNGSIVHLSLNNCFLRNAEGLITGVYGIARDISALKMAKKKLQESQERFEKLSALTSEGVIIHKNAIITDVNKSLERLVGYAYDELIGQSIIEKVIHPQSHQIAIQHLQKKHIGPYDVVAIRKGGQLFDMEIDARDIDYNGEVFRVAAVRDVTERNKAAIAIKENSRINAFLSQLSFHLASEPGDIIKNVALPMIKEYCGASYAHFSIYNPDSKTLQLLHIDADSVVVNLVKKAAGKKIFSTLSPVSDDAHQYILLNNCKLLHSLTELSFGVIPSTVDKTLKAATGFYCFYAIAHALSNKLYGVTILAFKKNQKLPSEKVLTSYANILAVSFRKKIAQDKLRTSEHKLKTIIKIIPDLLFHIDKNGTFVDFYQPHHEGNLYQFPEVFVGKTIYDVFPDDHAAKFQAAIDETLAVGHCTIEYELSDNEQRSFVARMAQLNEHEIISIVSEITQLKKYAQDLEVLNTTKDRLFSIIGHDLKNPLNNIIGFAQLIESKVGDPAAHEKHQKYNQLILKSGFAISHLLNNLLLWARAQRKQILVSPIHFNLHELINECFELNRPSFEEKQISFSNNVSLHMSMCADRSMMLTVFRNLVVNAYKFTQQKGMVSVSAEFQKHDIRIHVSDNGVGIHPSRIKSLFDISETTSANETNAEEATGLGLVICKEFVELHNGLITVESTLNAGTTFTVIVPNSQGC